MNIEIEQRFNYIISLTNYSFEELSGLSRKRDVVQVRQMIMYFCYHELNMTLPDIGRRLNRDHSTVMYGRDTFAHLLSVNNPKDMELKRYRLILHKYYSTYPKMADFHYICAEKLEDKLTAFLFELQGFKKLTPVQNIVNEAKKTQLEKIINLINEIKNDPKREMDSRITYIGKTTTNVKSSLSNV